METRYLLEVDETYRLDGKRSFYNFVSKDEATKSYRDHWRGMVNLLEINVDENGKESKKLLCDENGRRYIKGSPFYNFPHVPHISKIDGKEIEST